MKDSTKIVLGVIALPVVFSAYALWGSIFTKPVDVLQKATNTDKMIANYEWFHEAPNQFNARVAQIAQFKELMANETDKSELSRLRIDLAGISHSCREIAAKYTSQTTKAHVGYLKSNSLPESLDSAKCQ